MTDREFIKPNNEAHWLAMRLQDVTSTESPALFDQSPYETKFELWHRKHDGRDKAIEQSERMLWGTRLQDSIAYGIGVDYGVKVMRQDAYVRIPDSRMGSSFDFEIFGAEKSSISSLAVSRLLISMYEDHGPGILEIKNVDSLVFRNQWVVEKQDDGSEYIEAPPHIEIQLQHQLHVSRAAWGVICALVGGNTIRLVTRMAMPDVGKNIEAKIAAFWNSIERNEVPAPHFPDDAAFVASLYGYAEPGRVIDLRENAEATALAQQYLEAADREKLAKEDKSVAQAQLLQLMGDAERAILAGYNITASMVAPAEISYTRKEYRGWRVTRQK